MSRNPYGVSITGYSGSAFPPNRITDMQTLGLGWCRNLITWSNIETPSQGQYDWAKMDSWIQSCNAIGVKSVFALNGAPSWGQSSQTCSDGINTKNRFIASAVVSFVTALLQRYAPGSINGTLDGSFELANEGFDDSGSNYCNTPASLLPIAQALYPLIKSVNPNLLVGMPAHLGGKLDHIEAWQQAIYDSGMGSLFDYSNGHYYATNRAPWDNRDNSNQSTFESFCRTIHMVDQRNGYGRKQLWITETGWPRAAQSGTVTDQQQADYLQYILEVARRSGYVTRLFWFTLSNSNGFSPVQGGVGNQTFWPAFYAWQSSIAAHPTWDDLPNGTVVWRAPRATGQPIIMNQGDTSPALQPTFLNSDGTVLNLTGATFTNATSTDSQTGVVTSLNGTWSIVDAATGKAKYQWQAADTASVGKKELSVTVTPSGGSPTMFDGHLIEVKLP